jgi:hypothetical protein
MGHKSLGFQSEFSGKSDADGVPTFKSLNNNDNYKNTLPD